jgi:hypothetical protein
MLSFPSNPTQGLTYQSGSSSTYEWNGDYWVIVTPPTQVFITAENLSTVATTNANGNYIDIGNVRYQWGTNTNAVTSQRTITLPAAFANTNYSVIGNVVDQSSSDDRVVVIGTRSTTNFLARVTVNAAGSAASFNWMAIGLKP